MRSLIPTLAVLGSVLFSDLAAAGCPNMCTLKVEPAQVTPQTECITFGAPEEDDCDCELRIEIRNGCEDPIEPQNFSLAFCGNDVERCSVIAAGDYGIISVPLTEVGTKTHVFPIKVGEVSAEITVVADVKSFDESGCSVRTPAKTSPLTSWTGVMLAAAAWMGTRRSRRTRGARK